MSNLQMVLGKKKSLERKKYGKANGAKCKQSVTLSKG
jgi:hypothetical protein